MNKIIFTSIIILTVVFTTNSQMKFAKSKLIEDNNSNGLSNFSKDISSEHYLLANSNFLLRQRISYKKRHKRFENIIKLNLTNLLFLSPTIAYERVINDMMSIGSSVLYSYFNWDYIGFKIDGPRVFINYKYYFMGTAPEGIYGLGYFSIGNLNLSIKNVHAIDPVTYEEFTFDAAARFFSLNSGIGLGYQKIFSNNLTLDIYGGIGFGYSTLTILSGSDDLFDTNIIPSGKRFGFSLGWAF